MKGRKMIATVEVTEQQGEEIETKIGRLKRMKDDGREIEAFQIQAELYAQHGIWVD